MWYGTDCIWMIEQDRLDNDSVVYHTQHLEKACLLDIPTFTHAVALHSRLASWASRDVWSKNPVTM